jgi:hypothetical protein
MYGRKSHIDKGVRLCASACDGEGGESYENSLDRLHMYAVWRQYAPTDELSAKKPRT